MKLFLIGALSVFSVAILVSGNMMPGYYGMQPYGYGGNSGNSGFGSGGFGGLFQMLIFLFVFILIIQVLFGSLNGGGGGNYKSGKGGKGSGKGGGSSYHGGDSYGNSYGDSGKEGDYYPDIEPYSAVGGVGLGYGPYVGDSGYGTNSGGVGAYNDANGLYPDW